MKFFTLFLLSLAAIAVVPAALRAGKTRAAVPIWIVVPGFLLATAALISSLLNTDAGANATVGLRFLLANSAGSRRRREHD